MGTAAQKASGRVWAYDLVRTVCMLWVVALWHNHLTSEGTVAYAITIAALGAFTFRSGMLNQRKWSYPGCLKKAIGFYENRFLRLYPFYFLSCVTLYFIPGFLYSRRQLFFTLTDIACITNGFPMTVWYCGMILAFYVFTPLVGFQKTTRRKILCAAGILAMLIAIWFGYRLEVRMIYYWPAYAAGMLVKDLKRSRKALALSFACFAAAIAVYAAYPSLWIHIPMALSGAVLIIEAALWIEYAMRDKGALLKKVVTSISAASMIAYLFHRQYFILFNPLVEMTKIQVLRLVFLPLFLLLCFCVQKLYSKAIAALTKARRTAKT